MGEAIRVKRIPMRSYKFGIEFPKTMEEALALDTNACYFIIA